MDNKSILTEMKQVFLFCAIATIVWACGGNEPSSSTSSAAATPTAVAKPDGKKIYKQYCVTCHGLYGDMGASGAHDLTASALSVDERIVVVTKGRGAMTPFENLLDAEEIAAVAEYTLELKKD